MEEEGRARVPPPIGDCGSGSGRRKEREKGKEESWGWDVQAFRFSTLSTDRT